MEVGLLQKEVCDEVDRLAKQFLWKCLTHPHKPQYKGGIIQNPELNNGSQGWIQFGDSTILDHRESLGNRYIVAHKRKQPHDSVSQKVFLQKNKHYALSAWIQVSGGNNVAVTATVKTRKGEKIAGATVAKPNCWSMLKGGLTTHTSGLAQLYVESNNTDVEIWVDSVSLQPFTEEEWKSHQDHNIEKARKRSVSIQIVDQEGKPLRNASVSIQQTNAHFPFGSSIDKSILNNPAYQNWFLQRFTVTTFGNEMKWYSTEYVQGREDYSVPDAMLAFAKQHNIAVRGHNIFWDDPNFQPGWVPSLSPQQLSSAVQKRLQSVVSRYRGQVIHWDVVNENMHFSFFENKLGQDFSAKIYSEVHRIDEHTPLFLNEYNTIEDSRDNAANPAKYIQKLREMRRSGAVIGIGLEAHFPNSPPNLPYMRASIDTLAATGSPLWITEIDVAPQNNQVQYFEQVLREAHSHPGVQGMIMWTGRTTEGCYRLCLTDSNFKNLPAGDVVDKLLHEWGLSKFSVNTDHNGFIHVSLFHGDYNLEINHPLNNNNYSFTHHFQVNPTHHHHHHHHGNGSQIITQIVKLSV
ncbi:hypothetical protein PIB30_052634 [Stylosanthes scabra]|uniref:GH10 domain-containing protein n=1 Tax=Stylosanthes scabra TaxID=79078 RepID=A0ABU6VIF6_9FABA|nr:hypothetical protein [Stylosanthes scabra]